MNSHFHEKLKASLSKIRECSSVFTKIEPSKFARFDSCQMFEIWKANFRNYLLHFHSFYCFKSPPKFTGLTPKFTGYPESSKLPQSAAKFWKSFLKFLSNRRSQVPKLEKVKNYICRRQFSRGGGKIETASTIEVNRWILMSNRRILKV